MVTFKEDTHQYFNVFGTEYKSVTTILHQYTTPFDEKAMAERVAMKQGRTKEDVLAEWARLNAEACDYGTAIHLLMENYIKDGIRGETNHRGLYDSFDAAMEEYVGRRRAILSELVLWNDEARIAGTSDLVIELNDDEFCIGDFKTNKKFTFFSSFGDNMSYPVEHLTDCKYSVYSLQLSMYGYFHELLTGRRCRNVFLLYLKDGKWEYIPANYMKYEVMAILNHYKSNKLQKH